VDGSKQLPALRIHPQRLGAVPGGGMGAHQSPAGCFVEGLGSQRLGGVVKKAQAHAKATHGMDLSREQALSMAKPALVRSRLMESGRHTKSTKHLS
jgi:hypothetical protein